MEYYKSTLYAQGDYFFPDFDNTTTEEKQTPGYAIKCASAMYSYFAKNKAETNMAQTTYFDVLRLYGKGKQSPNKYKTFYSGSSTSGSTLDTNTEIDTALLSDKSYQRSGWMNVMWDDIVSFIPNMKRSIKGRFDWDFDVKASNIDIDSGAEEETEMYRAWAKAQFGAVINTLRTKAGLQQEKMDFVPNSKEELERIKSLGGFKAPYVSELEKLITHCENISQWDRSLKGKMLDDLLDFGYAFAMPYYDDETAKVKWRYLDPKLTGIQYSRYSDFRDADWFFTIEYVNPSFLRQRMEYICDDHGNPATYEKILEMVKGYCGFDGNPDENEWDSFKKVIDANPGVLNKFRIPVLHCYWNDVETEKKIEYKDSNFGRVRYYKYDNTVKKLGKREALKSIKARSVYGCSWIMGTNYAYDYGKMPNQPGIDRLPIVGFSLKEKSIVETLLPIADLFQIAWLKFENAVAKATNGGYAIDWSRMVNITDGDKKVTMGGIIDLWRQEQLFFYKTSQQGYNVGGSPVPINQLPGNMKDLMSDSILLMDRLMKMVEDLTGLNPLYLGAAPQASSAVGTTEMSMQASNANLQTLIDGVRVIKEGLATLTAPMLQLSLTQSEKAASEYSKIIGSEGVEILKMAKDMHVAYGIELVARPTQQDWNDLLALAKNSFDRRNQGQAGVDEAQFAMLSHMKLNGGNLLDAYFKMSYWIQKDQERIRQERNEGVQLQGQQIEKQIAMKAQADERTKALDFMAKKGEIGEQLKADIQKREHDSQKKIEEILAQVRSKKLIEDNSQVQ